MKDREVWHAAVHGVAKSRTQFSNWTTTTQRSHIWCPLLFSCLDALPNSYYKYPEVCQCRHAWHTEDCIFIFRIQKLSVWPFFHLLSWATPNREPQPSFCTNRLGVTHSSFFHSKPYSAVSQFIRNRRISSDMYSGKVVKNKTLLTFCTWPNNAKVFLNFISHRFKEQKHKPISLVGNRQSLSWRKT